MKRSVWLLTALLLLVAAQAGLATDLVERKVPATIAYPSDDMTGGAPIPENAWRPGPDFNAGELDEYLGDTLSVGNSYYNAQHNCTMGRMIAFTDGEVQINGQSETNVAFFSWMDKPSANEDVHIAFNRAYVDDSGDLLPENFPEGYRVDVGNVAAYVTLGFDAVNKLGFPVYHGGNSGEDMGCIIAREWNIIPGTFLEDDIPGVDNLETFWPRSAYDSENGVLHVVTTVNPEDPNGELVLPQPVYYSQHVYDPATETFTIGEQVLLCEWQRNISADIAVSADGERVAVAATISRDYFEHPDNSEEWTQYNQDIWLYESSDGGETWGEPVNITDFIPPDEDLLPDTTAANRDTLRAYCDVNTYFDTNDNLHLAFTTAGYFDLQGTLYPRFSWIYHWDEVNNVFTLAVNGKQYCYDPGGWHRAADRPNMYQDPDNGVLYMSYQQLGLNVLIGDTLNPLYETNSLDYSQSGFANGEVFITASPDGGLKWAKGINLTNTRYDADDQGAATGDARSETSPTIALDNEGDYLNLFYILDYEGGNARQEEGAYTQNNAVWQRVSKDDVMASFEEWVVNYPLHVDSSQFWADPDNWEWNGFLSVADDRSELQPGEFNLAQNYPNPFNPTTSIEFSLQRAGHVKLAVYDLLGREVSTLVNRALSSGSHTITFDGGDLASGVYFVKMTSGSHSAVRKMTLMK